MQIGVSPMCTECAPNEPQYSRYPDKKRRSNRFVPNWRAMTLTTTTSRPSQRLSNNSVKFDETMNTSEVSVPSASNMVEDAPSQNKPSHLPDVKIHCSDEYFFSRYPGDFVRPNPDYKPLESIANVSGGMHSGQKGRHPLFCCDRETAKLIREDDPLDLTLVYKLTERIFS